MTAEMEVVVLKRRGHGGKLRETQTENIVVVKIDVSRRSNTKIQKSKMV